MLVPKIEKEFIQIELVGKFRNLTISNMTLGNAYNICHIRNIIYVNAVKKMICNLQQGQGGIPMPD